jgi:hypothetical protein
VTGTPPTGIPGTVVSTIGPPAAPTTGTDSTAPFSNGPTAVVYSTVSTVAGPRGPSAGTWYSSTESPGCTGGNVLSVTGITSLFGSSTY